MRSITLDMRVFWDLVGEILHKGKAVRLVPKGGSMEPTIVTGDKVIVASVDEGSIEVGDVVVVAYDRPKMHRVKRVDKQARLIFTQGDAFGYEDTPISTSLVLGRVVRAEKNLLLRVRRLLGRIKSTFFELITDKVS